jgi:CheY-like chemotaxis protein
MRQHRPDLLITDVMMPGLDGFALAQAVRKDPDVEATPVIMLSARAGAEATGEGFASGADDYLAKPFTSAELVGRVEARLRAVAREREHRARGEATVRYEAAIADMTAAISAAESIPAVLAALAAGPLGTSAVALASLDSNGQHLTMHYGGEIEIALTARYHRIALDAPVPIAHVVTTDQAMIVPDTGRLDRRYDQVVRDTSPGVRSSVMYPLHDAATNVIGALALMWPEPSTFLAAQISLFEQAAAVTGQALARINITSQEHRIAIDFQEHLLDLDRSSTEVAVAASYQSANQVMRVGGDWYLATPLGEHCVGVCVGDVVGHGLPAATVMGRLRAAVAATAMADPDPEYVLTHVQRYAATVPGARCSTLAYATLNTATGLLDYISAGHPYPLLVGPDGQTRLLEGGRVPPLAAFTSPDASASGQVELPPGSTVILYTDGLIERRGESLDAGFARLLAAASDCGTMATDAACTTLLNRMTPPGGYTDDVAILALRPVGSTATSWVATRPATPDQLPPLRHELRDWLTGLGFDPTHRHNLLIAVGEAVANAMEHGSGLDPRRTVTIEAFATPETVRVAIRDTGQWRGDSTASHRSGLRGRGLTLIYGLADQAEVARTPRGTTVTLRFHRSSPPTFTTGASS